MNDESQAVMAPAEMVEVRKNAFHALFGSYAYGGHDRPSEADLAMRLRMADSLVQWLTVGSLPHADEPTAVATASDRIG